MLSGSFFTIGNSTVEGDKMTTHFYLNPSHEIFAGHFPGMPVVPGVCMVEMLKEVMEEVIGVKTKLKKAGNIKFLHVLDPNVYPEVMAELKVQDAQGDYTLSARIFFNDIIFLKMDAVFCAEVHIAN
ncbi:MAG TPA: hypothetical protein PLU53_05615 [Bacteroidia bacterium]|nr:hypothetical protein [Bacteroidia bacterium]